MATPVTITPETPASPASPVASVPTASPGPPTTPAPVPAAAEPGGIDRFTWGIVAGVVLLVVAGLIGVAIVQRRAVPPDLTQPDGVVRAFVEAVDSGRPDQAWDLLATPARSDVSREEFMRRAMTLSTRPPSRVAIENVRLEGDTARVEASRTYTNDPFGGSSMVQRSTVLLTREQGAWRIEVPPEPYLVSSDLRTMP